MKSFYDILGVSKFASDVEIKKAYILRSKMMHPDRFNQTSQKAEWAMANEMLKELNHAYGVLKDPVSRSTYDRTVGGVYSQQSAHPPQSSMHSSPPPRSEAEPPPMPKRPQYQPTRSKKGVKLPQWVYTLIFLGVIGLIGKGCETVKNKAPSAPSDLRAGASYPATPRYTPFPLPVVNHSPVSKNIILQAASPTPYLEKYEPEFIDWLKEHPSLENLSSAEMHKLHEGWLCTYSPHAAKKDLETMALELRDQAVRYSSLSTEKKSKEELYRLGRNYENGIKVTRDYSIAAKYYKISAEKGYCPAQGRLGYIYAKGLGVPVNMAEAVKWFQLAADQGDAQAQANLGVAYDRGEGVPKSLVRAYMWSNIAAANGHKGAVKNRDFLTQQMSLNQIEEAQRLSSEWSPQSQVIP
jgi:hypothetical protein